MQGPALLKCQAFLECQARLVDEVRLEDEQLVVLEIQKEAVPHSVAAEADPVTSESAVGLFGSLPCWGCG